MATTEPSAAGASLIKPEYDPSLTNADLAPLQRKHWTWYNFFAFWMSDIHSVGGYVFAGSLFALGISAWQVLLALVVGIFIVYGLCNLVARPSQAAGVPYPVAARISFGVIGANIPALIRGMIAVAWYGIQTYLASHAVLLLFIKMFPGASEWANNNGPHAFLGLSAVGWGAFALMWLLQAALFWNGMEAIRKFIDICGPAVYVVMFALAIYLIAKAGWSKLAFDLGGINQSGWAAFGAVLGAIALVVSYFAGPMLNFGDFSRYGRSFADVNKGNFWGLPVNFLVFAVLVVATVSTGATVIGRNDDGSIITDPVVIVDRLDSTTAAVLGVLTFAVATIGINIVANFVSPAFDFSNVAPHKISWRTGGIITAVLSVVITPWNLYNNPQTIHYTLDTFAAFFGPLFGILIVDFYLVRRQKIVVDDLFTKRTDGAYWYQGGVNVLAAAVTVLSAAVGISIVIWGSSFVASFSWFIGAALGSVLYYVGALVLGMRETADTAEQHN